MGDLFFVGRDEAAGAGFGCVDKEFPDGVAPVCVLVRGRLVGEEHAGVEDESARERGSLLLADGGFVGRPAGELGEAEPVEEPFDCWSAVGEGAGEARGVFDVLADREFGEEAEALREEGEL